MIPTFARGAGAAAALVLVASALGEAQEPIVEAKAALAAGRYDEAIAGFSLLSRRDPANPEVVRGLVASLLEVGRNRDAERAARDFKRDNPHSVEMDGTLGRVLYAAGRAAEAEPLFVSALSASDSLAAEFNLAVLEYDRGEADEAMNRFDRFIDVYNRSSGLSSDQLTVVASAVRYLGLRNPVMYEDALRAYEEAILADETNLEARVQLGEMLLEKYNGSEAEATFREVLELNPNSPRGLLGMAKANRFNGMPGGTSLVERSLEVNPNLVAAHLFKATVSLELERYDAAEREVERALGVNPNSLEALSLRAASQYLQGDERGFAETTRRVLDRNPHYDGLYTTLADVSARNRLYREAAGFARRALQVNQLSWRGYALLGINLLRTGDIAAGRRNLEAAFAGDPYDVWTKNTLDLLDDMDRYSVAATDRFQLVADSGEADVLAIYLGDLAEAAYDDLAAAYGYRAATPIRIEVFPRHADFSVRTVGLVGLGALGVSFGPVVAMDSPAAREIGDFNWGATLWHELAHSFHLEMSAHRVPRWFTEGLAAYEERRAGKGWGNRLTRSFLVAYREGKLLPVGELNEGFTRPSYPGQLEHAYYEASLVCELIERERGSGALVELLRGYARGESTAELFQTVLGMDLRRFDDLFNDFLNNKFGGIAASFGNGHAGEGGAHTRENLIRRARSRSNDFEAQLGLGRILYEAGDRSGAVPYLERAKELFPQYAEGDGPYWYLAQIYRERGDLRRAAAELTSMATLNERHYKARLELADVYLELSNKAAAARSLQEAMYIYPLDAEVHVRLAELDSELGERRDAVRERRAVVALNPVDLPEALYQLARAYLEAGNLEQARRTILRALEDAPGFEEAQQLLLEIHAKRRGGAGR